MSIVDTVKKLPNPVLVLFIASKFFIGLGFGVLFACHLGASALWIIIIGILMSVPGAYIIWFKK